MQSLYKHECWIRVMDMNGRQVEGCFISILTIPNRLVLVWGSDLKKLQSRGRATCIGDFLSYKAQEGATARRSPTAVASTSSRAFWVRLHVKRLDLGFFARNSYTSSLYGWHARPSCMPIGGSWPQTAQATDLRKTPTWLFVRRFRAQGSQNVGLEVLYVPLCVCVRQFHSLNYRAQKIV